MRWTWMLLGMAGCFDPPDLDLVDAVPLVPQGACAPNRVEWVSCVLDGDTFDLVGCGGDNERIRMLGIDAPEIAHGDDPADCFGDEAGAELRRLIAQREVLLTFDQDCYGIFGRTLAYVWVQDDGSISSESGPDTGSILLNEYLLQEGFARRYEEDFGNPLRLEDRLVAAEAQAEARGLGLWAACPGGG